MLKFKTSFLFKLIICLLFNFSIDGGAKDVYIEVIGKLSIDTTDIEISASKLTSGQLNRVPNSDEFTLLDLLKGHRAQNKVETPVAITEARTVEYYGVITLDTTSQLTDVQLSEGYASNNVELGYGSETDNRDSYLLNLVGFDGQLKRNQEYSISETKTVLTSLELDTTVDSHMRGLSDGFSQTQIRFSSQATISNNPANEYIQFLQNSPIERSEAITESVSYERITALTLDSTNDNNLNGVSDGFELTSLNLEYHKQIGGSHSVDDYLGILEIIPKGDHQVLKRTEVNDISFGFTLDTSNDANESGLSDGFENTKIFLSGLDHSFGDFLDEDFFLFLHSGATDSVILKQFEVNSHLFSEFTLDTTQDSDGDGITDGAEARFVALDFDLFDSDGDGLSDQLNLIGEFHKPLPPVTSAIESFKIDSLRPNAMILLINGQFSIGDTIHVLQTSDFLEWKTIFSATSTTDGPVEYSFAVPLTDAQGFFRIVLAE